MFVGIDLGTTYSAVATYDKNRGEAIVLKNTEGEITTPSVVWVEGGKTCIGNEAKSLMSFGNCNCAAFYKNMMGDDYSYSLDGKDYTAEDLSAIFLKKLKADIEEANGIKIDGAVITVPAYFDEKRRRATMNAGKRAGINVLKIINEPTAAIIAYGLTGSGKKNVMVYDLGGGTFDITIAAIDGTHVRVLTTNGDHMLGGRDWDGVLRNELAARFAEEYGVDLSGMPEELNELQVQCEEIKKRLSSVKETVATVRGGGFVGKYPISREYFEEATEGLLNQTKMLIEGCFTTLRQSGSPSFGWKSIDEVVLVGGSTRMPQVRNYVVREFGKEPVTKNVNVDTIVALGAALQAELCTAQTLTLGGSVASMGSQIGAARQEQSGGLLVRGSDIEDITAHSLGMLAFDRSGENVVNSIILKKDSRIGVAEQREYKFRGETMEVYVLQGESTDPFDCELLYQYKITGMRAGGEEQLTVSYLYNANGMVEVRARTADGRSLHVEQVVLQEDLASIIARLKKQREEARNRRLDVMMIIDISGSMDGDSLDEAKRAMENFVRTADLNRMDISIVKFASKSDWHCRFTGDGRELLRKIAQLEVSERYGYGTEGANLFKKYGRELRHPKDSVIIVLTDGVWVDSDVAIREASDLKEKGITIYAVGVEGADEVFLSQIASKNGAVKLDLNKLCEKFGEIASSIASEQ